MSTNLLSTTIDDARHTYTLICHPFNAVLGIAARIKITAIYGLHLVIQFQGNTAMVECNDIPVIVENRGA